MKAYLNIVGNVLANGRWKGNRTGVDTIAIPGAMFEHDMKEGFPLITTKKVSMKNVASELEFFIKGITDKRWLEERGNTIWSSWCAPFIHKDDKTPETRAKMKEERDLGPIYGWQWRNFGAYYTAFDKAPVGHGVDQLNNVIETLRKNPNDRRMIVSAWNPQELQRMALPPCHYGFQLIHIDGEVSLMWNQRSVDVAIGLPYNIASYGLLLELICKDVGLKPGKLVGFLGDVHIYKNHLEGIAEQINRAPRPLPKLNLVGEKTSIFDWDHSDRKMIGYDPHPAIDFEIAI